MRNACHLNATQSFLQHFWTNPGKHPAIRRCLRWCACVSVCACLSAGSHEDKMPGIVSGHFICPAVQRQMLKTYQEAKPKQACDEFSSLLFFFFSVFQSCRVTHVAPRASYQMESFMARATTWGTKSDTAASQASCWKDTASSHALYHLAAEHSGTSHHPFAEVGFSSFSSFLSLCQSVFYFYYFHFSFFSHSKTVMVRVGDSEGPRCEVTVQRKAKSSALLVTEPEGSETPEAKLLGCLIAFH